MVLRWENDKQSYQGLFRPREQTQWLVTTPVDSFYPIEIGPVSKKASSEDSSDKSKKDEKANTDLSNEIAVKYLLDSPCSYIILVDENRRTYFSEEIKKGEFIKLGAVEYDSAVALLSRKVVKPSFPPNYSQNQTTSLAGWFSGSYRYNMPQSMKTTVNRHFSIESMENVLSGITQVVAPAPLEPRTFYMQIESGDHIDSPLKKNS